jgi:hypothetical protein
MSFSKRATYYILVGFVFLLNSCHSIKNASFFGQGIKTVRASKQIDENNADKLNSIATFNHQELTIENYVEEIKTNESVVFEVKDEVKNTNTSRELNVKPIQLNPEDSLSTAEKEYIAKEALETEELARKARKTGLSGLILSLIPFLGFFGLILSIIGLSKSIRALKAPYITEDGLQMARTGLILSIVSIGLRVLALIILITVILLFI